jgi:hypothetical protein
MTPGDGRDPARADRERAGPSPEDGRAETYLRLCAESELRRALTLPRYEPPAPPGLPAPLRLAAGLARPAASVIAGAAQPVLPLAGRTAEALRPLADSAARALQPLADRAAAVRPVAGDAARRLQPLAGDAVRTVRPLADRVAAAVQPVASEAARRLQPLAWQAADRLRMLRYGTPQALTEWRWRVEGTIATVGRRRPGPERHDRSAEEGVHRLRTVARALSLAGAIDRGTADSILNGLETALAVRSRVDPHRLAMREFRAMHHPRPARAPTGPYLAAPVGVAVQPEPDSGLAELRLFTLVLAPDQAVLSAAGRLAGRRGRSGHPDPWPVFGPGQASATDDRGNSYELHEASSSSDSDGGWAGFLGIFPIPPPGIGWLELTFSPGSPAIRVDLTGLGSESGAGSGPVPAGRPAERVIDAAAVSLLHDAVTHGDEGLPWHDLSGVADIVTALDAVGALAPARGAVGRLITLAGRLGVEVPAAVSAAAEPADLPADWASVLENRGRRDGPHGGTPAAVVLPELDGARFVLAGLQSDPAGAALHVLAWGWDHGSPFFSGDADGPWSWSARDDKGRWHIATEGGGGSSDDHAELQLHLVPPLHPEATSLEVTLAGPTGQVTATVPLDWDGRGSA